MRAAARVATTWTEFEHRIAAKAHLVTQPRQALGYGGMIHQFKNMVLRRDAHRVEAVRADAKAAERELDAYRSIGADAGEAQSLQTIGAMIAGYESGAG